MDDDVIFETDAGLRTALDLYRIWLDGQPNDGQPAEIMGRNLNA